MPRRSAVAASTVLEPAITCTRPPGLPAPPGDLTDELSLEALLVETALAGDHDIRFLQARVEADHARARRPRRGPGGPRRPPRARRRGRRPRRSSPGRAGRAAGSRQRDQARAQRSRPAPRRRPSEPRTPRRPARTAPRCRRAPPASPPGMPPVLLERLDRPAASVRRRGATGCDQHPPRARLDRGGDQLARPGAARRLGVALALGDQGEARRRGRLDDRRRAVAHQARTVPRSGGRADRAPGRSRHSPSIAPSRTSAVPSPPSAAGQRSAAPPARSTPRPIASATSLGAEGPLERIRSD